MSPGNEFIDALVKDNLKAPSAQPSGPLPPTGCVFAERFLRWVTANAYDTPVDEFQAGLGALWLSWCFDHDVNPFLGLHAIVESGFPFKEALGSEVPAWLASQKGNRHE